jgi:hypothetical protein
LLDHQVDDPTRYAIVRYEDLVRQPEATLRELCRFVQIDFVPEMLEFHLDAARHTERDQTGAVADHHVLTLESFRPDRAERWRGALSPRHVALVEEVAGTVMDRLEYRPSADPDRGPGRIRRFFIVSVANVIAVRRRLRDVAVRLGGSLRRIGRGLRSRGAA